MAKSTVTKSANIRAVVDTNFPADYLPNTDIAAARDVKAGILAHGRVIVARAVVKKRLMTVGRISLAG